MKMESLPMAKDEKALLYKQLLNTDRWLVLERMRVLGFWPDDTPMPEESAAVQKKRTQLENDLTQLHTKGTTLANPKVALAKERIRRWEESKQRRTKASATKKIQQTQRCQQWKHEKSTRLFYVGDGLSAGLENKNSNEQRLSAIGLPILHNAEQLANAMNIEIGTLRWLTFHRRAVTLVHYHCYTLAKKSGGIRHISAPKPTLAKAQNWVLEHILNQISVEPNAHGFIRKKSIVSNATPHSNKSVVMNMDLEDFFPTVGFRRVKGLFQSIGYSEAVATVLSLVSTEPPRVKTALDGRCYYVALGDRVLPQGACTSPAISNLICRNLDRRLSGLAQQEAFSYTRYADDLTFSGQHFKKIGSLLNFIRHIITDEGFKENKRKTHVMHKGCRQEVTGLVVNDKLTVPRKERRRLRAILHNVAKNGLKSENRQQHPNFAEYLRGKVSYLHMINPENTVQWKNLLRNALSGLAQK